MIRLGITGGIGSGKSFVAILLRGMGVPVYDTDSAAKRLMTEDAVIVSQLTELLGAEAYVDGKLNKPLVAQFLFRNQQNAQIINSIVHPRVKADFVKWASLHKEEIVGMECAILFESGMDTVVDKVLTVSAPYELRLKRAMNRDGVSREKIEVRIRAQMPEEEKINRSDYVLMNDGSVDLQQHLACLLDEIAK